MHLSRHLILPSVYLILWNIFNSLDLKWVLTVETWLYRITFFITLMYMTSMPYFVIESVNKTKNWCALLVCFWYLSIRQQTQTWVPIAVHARPGQVSFCLQHSLINTYVNIGCINRRQIHVNIEPKKTRHTNKCDFRLETEINVGNISLILISWAALICVTRCSF